MDWQALALTLGSHSNHGNPARPVRSSSSTAGPRPQPLARGSRGPGSTAASFCRRPCSASFFWFFSVRAQPSAEGSLLFSAIHSPFPSPAWSLARSSTACLLPCSLSWPASGVEPALVDAARLLGASPMRIVFTLLVPLARRSLLAAAVLSFLHTVGEFGVVLMLGGDIPGATRTLSILLYNQVENFDYAAASRTAAILLALSVAALAAIYGGNRTRGGPPCLSSPLKRSRGSFHLHVECRFASEWTVIFGPSGAGKSTLLRLLAGLDLPDRGQHRARRPRAH